MRHTKPVPRTVTPQRTVPVQQITAAQHAKRIQRTKSGRRANWIAGATLIVLSSLAPFAPVAMAQRAGMGRPAGGGVVAARPTPVVAAAPHAGGVVLHTGAPIRVGAAPSRTPVGRVVVPPGGISRVAVNGSPVHRQGINFMSGLANLPLFPASFNGSPGLGFDFSHLAAINDGHFHSRFHHRFNNGFGFSGFLLTSPEVIVEAPAVESQQPPAEEIVASNAPGADSRSNLEDQFLPSTSSSVPAPPPRDEAEYVFVRRDGTLLFGVAFSWDHGTLHYITRDGLRRSVPQDALDMDATQQFNEQRGVSFHLPA